nr:H-type lectin domain-containing protein [Pseudoruegeria sp. HB172150]
MVGVDRGSEMLFSDFEHGGRMWSGTGPRIRRKTVTFSEPFLAEPVVHVSISMWDMDNSSNARADLTAEKVTKGSFVLVFRTWGDSRVARIRADWMAVGEVTSEDDWALY